MSENETGHLRAIAQDQRDRLAAREELLRRVLPMLDLLENTTDVSGLKTAIEEEIARK